MYDTIKQMLEDDFLKPPKKTWSTPVVIMTMAKLSLLNQLSGLNKVDDFSVRPMIYMGTILRRLRNAKYISSIDLSWPPTKYR